MANNEIKPPSGFVLDSEATPSTLPEGFVLDSSIKEEKPKTEGLFGTSIGQNSELLRKARIPQQMAQLGGKLLNRSMPEPTFQSVPLNAVLNTPGTLAEIGGNLIAGQLSPESILTTGALKAAQIASPFIASAGKAVAGEAEKLSGLSYKTPGVLTEAYKDPTLIGGKGLQSASQVYQEAKGAEPIIRQAFKEPMTKPEFIDKAFAAVKDGTLSPDEALEARKALDSIKNTMPSMVYHSVRDSFDEIAKQLFEGADTAYQKAVKAEALRTFLPINKTGTPSLLKGGVMAYGPKLLAPILSPFVQGVGASTAGIMGKVISPFVQNPVLGALAGSAKSSVDNLRTRLLNKNNE